jgi:hypothetical protein
MSDIAETNHVISDKDNVTVSNKETEADELPIKSCARTKRLTAARTKLDRLLSGAGELAKKKQDRDEKKALAQTKSIIQPTPCNDPLADVDAYDFTIETEAISKGIAAVAGGKPSSSQTFISQPSSSSAALPQTATLPCIVANNPLSSQVLDLSYDFSPRVTLDGEFILYATYTFASLTQSSRLLSHIQASNFRFCPHISTSGKKRRGKPPRPLISEVGTTAYQDSCEFCYTEFEVEVQYAVVGVRKAYKVFFRFWHSLGSGKEVARDIIWQAANGSEIDGSLTEFEKKGVRRRWDIAGGGNF